MPVQMSESKIIILTCFVICVSCFVICFSCCFVIWNVFVIWVVICLSGLFTMFGVFVIFCHARGICHVWSFLSSFFSMF